MAKIIQVSDGCNREVYALEGYGPGSHAVEITAGYSTGSEGGLHNCLDSFALAVLGELDDELAFKPYVYGAEDIGTRVYSKHNIGRPVVCAGWNPEGEEGEDAEGDEVDWAQYDAWAAGCVRWMLERADELIN